MHVSLILPCYNPPAGWVENIITRYSEAKAFFNADSELILVQDGYSTHISAQDIACLEKALPHFKHIYYPENKGKGYAIRQGVKNAGGELIIYTDIDFPYTTDSIRKIYDTLNAGSCDLAAGVKDEVYYKHTNAARKFISKTLRSMIRTFFSIPVDDTQCGLKGFKHELKLVFAHTTINRYLFDLEFIRNAHKQGYSIQAVPIKLNEGVQFRHINYRILIPEFINLIKLILK